MGLALIRGIGLGAGLMYFFDPDLGRRRRALVADQFTHAGHALGGLLGASTRDLGHRAWGLTAELGRRFRERATPSDEVLVERVRATLGHHASHVHAIEVAARGGHVLLRGPIAASELEGALQAAAAVPGVIDVADELSIHHNEPHRPARPDGTRPGPWPHEVSPAAKLIMGAAGAALALPIVRRAPITGLAVGGLGLILATRRPGGAGAGRVAPRA